MKARSGSSRDLSELVLLRRLRTQAAEMRLAAASGQMRERQGQLALSAERLITLEGAWRSTTSLGRLDLDASRRWAFAWQQERGDHEQAERQVEIAREEESGQRTLLATERQRLEVANAEHRRALRSELAARDEERLQDASERFSTKRGSRS